MRIVTILTLVMLVVAPAFILASTAQALDTGMNYVSNTVELGDTDPRTVAASVINAILGFLGIIAVVIILLGGFKWMTAGGNEEKVEEAQKLIKAGIIGLIIILAAWGIASFVLNTLINSTK